MQPCSPVQERKKLPAAQAVAMPTEESTGMCTMLSFYGRYQIEFHISGMVFCLIGGKVRRRSTLLFRV